MSKQRGQTANVHAARWQRDAAEQAALDWARCMDCGSANVLPHSKPLRAYERPLCGPCLHVRAIAHARALFPE